MIRLANRSRFSVNAELSHLESGVLRDLVPHEILPVMDCFSGSVLIATCKKKGLIAKNFKLGPGCNF